MDKCAYCLLNVTFGQVVKLLFLNLPGFEIASQTGLHRTKIIKSSNWMKGYRFAIFITCAATEFYMYYTRGLPSIK